MNITQINIQPEDCRGNRASTIYVCNQCRRSFTHYMSSTSF